MAPSATSTPRVPCGGGATMITCMAGMHCFPCTMGLHETSSAPVTGAGGSAVPQLLTVRGSTVHAHGTRTGGG